MTTRDKRGRFKKTRGFTVTAKGYARYTTGPNRNKYVHRVKMAKHLKRELAKDEDVHHKDNVKLNNKVGNLIVTGHEEHGWVSTLQHWYMRNKELMEQAEWDTYFADQVCVGS